MAAVCIVLRPVLHNDGVVNLHQTVGYIHLCQSETLGYFCVGNISETVGYVCVVNISSKGCVNFSQLIPIHMGLSLVSNG